MLNECPKCGEQLSFDDVFCPACGTRIGEESGSGQNTNSFNEPNRWAEPGEVCVTCVNESGSVLRRYSFIYDGSPEKTFEAVPISGYKRTGEKCVLVHFDQDGEPDRSNITFRYRKKHTGLAWAIGSAAAVAVCALSIVFGPDLMRLFTDAVSPAADEYSGTASVSQTAVPVLTPTETPTPMPKPMATLTPTKIPTPTPTKTPTPTPTKTPTPKPFSQRVTPSGYRHGTFEHNSHEYLGDLELLFDGSRNTTFYWTISKADYQRESPITVCFNNTTISGIGIAQGNGNDRAVLVQPIFVITYNNGQTGEEVITLDSGTGMQQKRFSKAYTNVTKIELQLIYKGNTHKNESGYKCYLSEMEFYSN